MGGKGRGEQSELLTRVFSFAHSSGQLAYSNLKSAYSAVMLLRKGLESAGSLEENVRQGVLPDINCRLDGRGVLESRSFEVSISRDANLREVNAIVQWGGEVRVHARVSCTVERPFSHRSNEGILTFQCTDQSLSRLLDKIFKNNVIDTESLCIISGEKVWSIICNIVIIERTNCTMDAAFFAALAALRAFRKPEIRLIREGSGALQSMYFYKEEERESLPLAIHYSPIAVTIGLFANTSSSSSSSLTSKRRRNRRIASENGQVEGGAGEREEEEEGFVLVVDPSSHELEVVDAQLTYFVNAHHEICLVLKSGGVPLPVPVLLEAAKLAVQVSSGLHGRLEASLAEVETQVVQERERRLAILQAISSEQLSSSIGMEEAGEVGGAAVGLSEEGGIDRNDPILGWSLLHQPAASKEKPAS